MRVVLALVTAALFIGACAATARPVETAATESSGEPAPATLVTPTGQVASAAPCAGLAPTQLGPRFGSNFPARTAAEVLAGAQADPYLRIQFEDLAGVRSGPIRDVRVPLCRIDLLRLGDPVFVRQHPSTGGSWLLPITYDGVILLTVFVALAPDGTGAIGGSRGGAGPIGGEAVARRAGDTPGDPVVSAELVYAAPASCAPRDTISWRLVRRSGTVVYFLADYPGAPSPGALFREDEMRFMSRTSTVPIHSEFRIGPSAKLASAC
jgi:hypothetical protein